MTDDIERVRTSEHASASSHDVFVERLRSRSARADARATERATHNHDVALDVVASEAEAYGAYVALMRSGLWLDVAFARDHASGVLYAACEPRATPTERRKDEPREARPRTIAVPFAVTRACVTPSFFDVVTSIAGACARESVVPLAEFLTRRSFSPKRRPRTVAVRRHVCHHPRHPAITHHA